MNNITVNIKTQHYIEYMYPGTIVMETVIKEIDHRNPNLIVLPMRCIGFRFFDRTIGTTGDEVLRSEKKNVSGWIYMGEKKSREEFDTESATYSSLKDGEFVVVTRVGQHLLLRENDEVRKYIPKEE